jgi:MFS family permease
MHQASRRRKFTAVSFLFAAFMFSFMIRAALSVAAPTLMKLYNITPAVMGNVLAGWNWTYTGALSFSGLIVDRFGPWLSMGAGSLIWGAATVALPLAAAGWLSLFLMRAVFGLGQGILVPSIATSVSRVFGPKERATAIAVAFSGNNVGTALATTVSAFILARYGWEMVFYVLGGGSLAMTLLWFLLFPERRVGRAVPDSSEPATSGQKIPWSSLFQYRSTWGIAFGQLGYLYAYFFFIAWLPAYFIIGRNMTLLRTGIYAALPFWAGMLGTLLGGWLSDYLIRTGTSRTLARKVIIGPGLAAFTVLVIAAAYAEPVWLVVTLLVLAVGCMRLATGPCNSLAIDLAPRSVVGSLTAIQNFFGNIGGLLAPIVGGYLLGATGSFTASLLVAGGMALFGAISFVFIVGDLDRDRIGEPQVAGRAVQVAPSGAA